MLPRDPEGVGLLPVPDQVAVQSGAFATRPPALERQALQLDITYRTDPDVAGLRPGDRAPDAPLGDTTLFLLRRRADWTVLAFDGTTDPHGSTGPADSTRALDAQVLDADALDIDGHLRRIYTPTHGERILIRPDGHLGWRGTATMPATTTTTALGYT